MPVSDFECQIARGQIDRYLDSGALSSRAMTGLEEHLAECPGCKSLVAERRAALLGSLGGVPTRAVVSMPVENPLIAALRARSEPTPHGKADAPTKAAPRYASEKALTRKPLGKPLALAALLAVVLLGMSRVSQFVGAPTARASAGFAADSMPRAAKPAEAPAPSKIEAPKETKAETKPAVTVPAPKAVAPKATAGKTFVAKPIAEKKPAPPVAWSKPTVGKSRAARAAPKRGVRRPLRRKAVALRVNKPPHLRRRPRSTVRVYGLDGRPLKP